MKLPARVSTRQYNYWIPFVFDGDDRNPGSGNVRKITPQVWRKLAVMGAVRELGFETTECARIASYVLDHWDDLDIHVATAVPGISLTITRKFLNDTEEEFNA
jgi:hypothetical protein